GPLAVTTAVSLTRPSYWGKDKLAPQGIVGERPTLPLVGPRRSLRKPLQFFGFGKRRKAKLRLRVGRNQSTQRLGPAEQRLIDPIPKHRPNELLVFGKRRLIHLDAVARLQGFEEVRNHRIVDDEIGRHRDTSCGRLRESFVACGIELLREVLE